MKEVLEKVLGAIQEGRDLSEDEVLEMRAALSAMETPEGEAEVGISRMGTDSEAEFRSYLRGEVRVLNTLTPEEGGYLVPWDFYNRVVEKRERLSVIRKLATVQTTSFKDTPIPIDACEGVEAAVIPEGQTYPDLDGAFEGKVLRAYKFGGITKVTEELAQDSAFDIEQVVSSRIARFLARAEDRKFINGTGTNEPYGLLNDVTVVNEDNPLTPGEITVDAVRLLVGSLDAAYLENATWLMSQSVWATLLASTNTMGDYHLIDFASGPVPKLAGRPIAISAYMPAVDAQQKPILVLGDFSEFLILDRQAMMLQVLKERYAEQGKIGYRFHARTDGAVVVPEAFVAVVTGTV